MIEDIEKAIVARLKERLPGRVSRIELFPDKPDNYDFPAAEQAAALVRFSGADFAPDDDAFRSTYAPREGLKFQVVFLVRALRRSDSGPISAYELKGEIRRALHGRSFCGTTPFRPRRFWLDGEHDGVWRWVWEFTASLPSVAEVPNDPDPWESSPNTKDRS